MNPTETLNLQKGERVALTKGNAGLIFLAFALGWDANSGNSDKFDLDASAILLNKDGKIVGPTLNESVCYFNNLKLKGLEHTGDNLTGEGDGDDEIIRMHINNVDASVEAVIFVVNIFDAASRRQKFGMVKNAYIRVLDGTTNQPLPGSPRFDLQEDYGRNTGVIFGRAYRHSGEWKFEAIGEGYEGDLNTAVAKYK